MQENQITYDELLAHCQQFQNIKWLDRNQIKTGNIIEYDNEYEIRQCQTRERNCCVVKIYISSYNQQVLDMLSSLNHFNQVSDQLFVVKILGYYINPIENNSYLSQLWVIQKQIKYNLLTVQKHKNISYLDRLKIMLQLTQTILNLHNSEGSIGHGDINPQNILLDIQSIPYLTGFVVSDRFNEQLELKRSRNIQAGYCAPEQFNLMQFCKSDIWSLGNKVDDRVIQKYGLYDPQRQGCLDLNLESTNETYSVISNLIQGMTQYNPANRISLQNVLETIKELIQQTNKTFNRNSNS